MSIVLVVVALLAGVIGLLFMSQATTGVGLICFACLLAILARMAQAHEHHKTAARILREAGVSRPGA